MCFPALAALPAALGIGGAGATTAATTAGATTAATAAAASSSAATYQAIGAGLSALGAALSAYQGVQTQRAEETAARRRAEIERARGDIEVGRLRDRRARELGARRAGLLSRGVALEGSAIDALSDAASELSLDEQAARFGARIRADDARFEARRAGARARTAALGGAIETIAPVIDHLASRGTRRT